MLQYKEKLYHYFVKVTAGNMVDAEDMVQTVFLKVLIHGKSYSGKGSYEHWLFSIARNVARDYFRLKNTRAFIENQQIDTAIPDETIYADRQEQIDLLYAAISRLHPRDREIIILSVFQKLSYKTIAGILMISETAAKTRGHRAKLALREKYFSLERANY